jgi:hypothetical protein
MPPRSHRTALPLLLLGCLVPAPTAAQSRFGLQLQGGGVAPLSAFVHSELPATLSAGSGVEPSLMDQENAFGFQIGTTFLLDTIEIRYSFHRMAWATQATYCVPNPAFTNEVVLLASGDIDDTAVRYECLAEPIESDISGSGIEPVNLHALTAGYRFYLTPLDGPLEAFVVANAGLTISSYTHRSTDNSLWATAGLGLGADVNLGSDFAIGVETRYNLFLSGPPGRFEAAVTRSAHRHPGDAVRASLEAFHALTFSLGVKLNFR